MLRRKIVRQFVSERFGINLCRSSCLNYPRLHVGRLFTGWGSPSSGPRSGWSRLTRGSERHSCVSMPPCGMRRGGQGPRYSLPTRPTSGQTLNCGASGRRKADQPWWMPPVRGVARRPAIALRCAWRPARWNGWNWRGTATAGPRLPSWNN